MERETFVPTEMGCRHANRWCPAHISRVASESVDLSLEGSLDQPFFVFLAIPSNPFALASAVLSYCRLL